MSYQDAVAIDDVRSDLATAGFNDAVIQYFGTAKDVMIRVPLTGDIKGAQVSEKVMLALHVKEGEFVTDTDPVSKEQTCSARTFILSHGSPTYLI